LLIGGGLGALSAVAANNQYYQPTSDSDISLVPNPVLPPDVTKTQPSLPQILQRPSPGSSIKPKAVVEIPIIQEMVSNNNKAGMGQGSRLAPRRAVRVKPRVRIARRPTVVTSAPVSIGNTIRGFASAVTMSADGAMVRGRDFCFTPIGTGSVQTWTMVGGAPLTPAAFVDSTLRQYLQMFNKFRFKSITAHYITSSPTSANGDVMFYYAKNRESVFLNQTSGNLLPFVISDPNTVIGPQWQNHSATFKCDDDWKSCDYGMDDDVGGYAAGEVFLLSKTSTTDSPGYVLFDYLIEFKEKSIIPRLLSLPITKALYSNVALNVNQATSITNAWGATVSGVLNLSGTASSLPTGASDGDLYKVIIDRTNSVAGGNATNVFTSITFPASSSLTSGQTIIMQDGTTLYALYSGNQNFTFYPSAAAAYAGNRPLLGSAASTVTGTTLQTWMSYVGSVGGIATQPNF